MTSSTTANGQTKLKSNKIRRKLQPAQSRHPLSIIKQWLVDNQIRMSFINRMLTVGMPLTILSALGTVHFLIDQPITEKFFFLSHFDSSTQLYTQGPSDWPFVTTWVLIFTLLRASLMEYIFYPIFNRFAPSPAPRTATRFAEQAWNVFYNTISFLVGLYIIRNSPYWGDMQEMWAGYPQKESSGFFKAYYLIETGFWVQQIIVLNIEARRKDFWQMLCHHIVTCTLIFMSYTYNTTHVGNVILCIMDFSDILLSVQFLGI
jgi:very-long-chain ceramide synthase